MKNGVYQLEIELALLRICEGVRDGVEGGGGRGKKKKLLVTTAASTRGNRNEPVQVRNLGSGSVRGRNTESWPKETAAKATVLRLVALQITVW